MLTHLYNLDTPIKAHFYIVKLGFTGVLFAQNIDFGTHACITDIYKIVATSSVSVYLDVATLIYPFRYSHLRAHGMYL